MPPNQNGAFYGSGYYRTLIGKSHARSRTTGRRPRATGTFGRNRRGISFRRHRGDTSFSYITHETCVCVQRRVGIACTCAQLSTREQRVIDEREKAGLRSVNTLLLLLLRLRVAERGANEQTAVWPMPSVMMLSSEPHANARAGRRRNCRQSV